MNPLVDVQRTAPDAYTYRVSAGGAQAAGDGGTFPSLEHCLFDAAASLDHYFPSVQVNLNGHFIGQYATLMLRRHASVVAHTIRENLAATPA